jgi:ornithine racemase
MPTLIVDQAKLTHNAAVLRSIAAAHGITSIDPVVKVFAGHKAIAKAVLDCGFSSLADSRLENLAKFKKLSCKKVLLRIGALSEAARIVRYADISLQSELATIEALDMAAKRQNVVHSILLMFDLGDLREGLFYESDYLPIVEKIRELKSIKLLGIGTNLTCYGGVVPSVTNMNRLVEIAETIEHRFAIRLEVISGGNSSIFPLLEQGLVPHRINHLRIGEALLFGRETAYGAAIHGMVGDVAVIGAELIERKRKPSFPIGEMTMNSFGETPIIADKGWMNRGILNLGKQDVLPEHLTPLDANINVLGGSSDHLIVDLGNSSYQIGETLWFKLDYPGLLQASTSPYVKKQLRR